MKTIIKLLILSTAISVAHAETGLTATAKERNDLPSCRKLFNLEQSAPARSYAIAVDQTTWLNPALVQDSVDRVVRSLKPGDRLQIVSFSGVNVEHFMFVNFDGKIDLPPTDNELQTVIPVPKVRKAQSCFSKQMELARNKVRTELTGLLTQPINNSPGKSEILKAVAAIGQQNFQVSGAPQKLLLLVSDMVENSDIVTFYGKHGLAPVDSQSVMAAVKQHGLLGDLQGAKVIVVGAAFVPDPKNYPGVKQREALKNFWQEYLTASHGQLQSWGEPALLGDIL